MRLRRLLLVGIIGSRILRHVFSLGRAHNLTPGNVEKPKLKYSPKWLLSQDSVKFCDKMEMQLLSYFVVDNLSL